MTTKVSVLINFRLGPGDVMLLSVAGVSDLIMYSGSMTFFYVCYITIYICNINVQMQYVVDVTLQRLPITSMCIFVS